MPVIDYYHLVLNIAMGELGYTYEEARYTDVCALVAGSAQRTDMLCRIGLLRRPKGFHPPVKNLPKLTPKLFDAMARPRHRST